MKSLIKFVLSLAVMLVSVYFIYDYYSNHKETNITIGSNTELIADLKEKYNNNEIMLYLEIPNVFSVAIPQTDNNEYYYKHDLSKKEDNNGTPFLDYRNKSLNDRKVIIYGHDTNFRSYKFNNILNYQNKDFFEENPYIYIYTNDGKKAYKIFTSFIEKDEDYLEIKNYTNIEFYEHLLKYKDKSLYDTKVVIDGESKVLVLTTRSSSDYEDIKNQVVMAIEDKDYKDTK